MENNKLLLIKEGAVKIYIHIGDKDLIPSKSMSVFYNKKMEINRDITNLVIDAYSNTYHQDSLTIIDSMAASGIGSIRILKECKNIKKIYINDVNPLAVDLIHKNVIENGLTNNKIEISISKKDANLLFLEIAQKSNNSNDAIIKKPNVISIDPFGTPNLYIDSAFKVIQRKNGLLCITATDTAVLFGIRPKTCMRKYISKPLHTNYCKEIGARILVYFISRIANINGMGIIPLLTFYKNHFIRVFCLTFKDKNRINESFINYGFIIHCKNCGYRTIINDILFHFPQKCPSCENTTKIDYAGPLWIDELHNEEFVRNIISLNNIAEYSNKKKIQKILSLVKDEINMPITYYNLHKLCQILKLRFVPKIDELINNIREMGYEISRTHFDYQSIKTNLNLKSLKNYLLNLKKK